MKHEHLQRAIDTLVDWITARQSHAKRMHKLWQTRDDRPYAPIPFRHQLELISPRREIDYVDEEIIIQFMHDWDYYDDMEVAEYGNKIWRHQFTGDVVCITYQRGEKEIHELCVYNERDLKELIQNG